MKSCKVNTIVSYYDLDRTPKKDDLQRIILECDGYGDLTKIVVFAEEEKDTLCLLQCLTTSSYKNIDISGYSLGDVGKHTRVISAFYGSQMVYAPITTNSSEYNTMEVNLQKVENILNMIRNAESIELMNQLQGKF